MQSHIVKHLYTQVCHGSGSSQKGNAGAKAAIETMMERGAGVPQRARLCPFQRKNKPLSSKQGKQHALPPNTNILPKNPNLDFYVILINDTFNILKYIIKIKFGPQTTGFNLTLGVSELPSNMKETNSWPIIHRLCIGQSTTAPWTLWDDCIHIN